MIQITTDNEKKWIEFIVKQISMNEKVDMDAIGMVFIPSDKTEITTAYWNSDYNDRILMAGHINADITDMMIRSNIQSGRYDWDTLNNDEEEDTVIFTPEVTITVLR